MTRSTPSAVSLPQRLAACALVVAGALCFFATTEGLRLRVSAIEKLTGKAPASSAPVASVDATAASAAAAVASAQANLSKAIEAFARADSDEAARFALTAQDDVELARTRADAAAQSAAIEQVQAGLQTLREQGLSREDARREAPPVFDFFRGFQDWGNPDATPGDDADDAPSAHPLGPARPLANGRHIMASLQPGQPPAASRLETLRA